MSLSLLRIKYVSRFSRPLSSEEVEALARTSAERNASVGVTGVLAAVGDIFLQVLEGPARDVEETLRRIAGDRRHRDVMILRRAEAVTERLFPHWSMRLLNLGSEARDAVRSISASLARYERAPQEERAAMLAHVDGEVWNVLSRAARREVERAKRA